MLSPQQQAISALRKNTDFLIVLPENPDGDGLGCALALIEIFKNSGKKIDIVCAGKISANLNFLSGQEIINNKIPLQQNFIVSVNVPADKIIRLRRENKNCLLEIALAEASGQKKEKTVRLKNNHFFYDLIIVLDAPDLESLGAIFSDNAELFSQKLVLNIDCRAANEQFGHINLTRPTAAACAEIMAELTEKIGAVNDKIATALLTGLIVKTQSFQNNRTTPAALNLASRLISQGGDREKIVRHLFNTKPIDKLRLWGRLLNRLNFDEKNGTAWISAAPEDFTATQTSFQDAAFVAEEILENFPRVSVIFIYWLDANNFFHVFGQNRQTEFSSKINAGLNKIFQDNPPLAEVLRKNPVRLREIIASLLNFAE